MPQTQESEASDTTENPPKNPSIKKTRIRGGYRAHARKICGEARDEIRQEHPSILTLQKHSLTLKNKLKLLREIDQQIFLEIKEEDIEDEVFQCEELQSEINGIIVEIEAKISALKTENAATSPSSQPVLSVASSSTTSSESAAKLPKIQLPKFYGDPKKWQEWWDSFEIIHQSQSLSAANKFRHLKSLLEGAAAKSISGIQVTGANYAEAIDVLQDRFAQKQTIIDAHMESLTNLPQVSSEKDLKNLRKLYDDLEVNIRSLKCLEVDLNQYGALLMPMVMKKIPEEIRLLITRKISKDEWRLERVLDVFKSELEAREQCGQSTTQKNLGQNKPNQNRSPINYTTSALVNSGGQITCSYCKGPHPSAKCNIVSNPQARKEILRKQGRCFVCLKKGHLSRNCSSNIWCFHCKQRHHASLCINNAPQFPTQANNLSMPVNSPNPLQSTNNQYQVRPEESTRNHSAQTAGNVGPSATTMFVDVKKSVLLQTAKGFISKAQNPEQSTVARMIFDSGSQRSYISERLRDSLALPTVSRETLTINAFGEDTGKLKNCDVTQFCVRSPYNSLNMYVNAYVVPVVCAPLKSQPINFAACNYTHLSGIPLADFPAENGQELNVDILIGSDYYWHFLTGGCIKGEQNGPVALDSTLGWILSGPVPSCPDISSTHANLAQTTHLLSVTQETETVDKSLEDQVSNFWTLESLGIKKGESSVYETFEEEIEFVGGRYQVKLPWKNDHPILPDNFQLSQKRFQGLFSKLKGNLELLKEYDSIIKDQEEREIIERVDPNSSSVVGKTHYLAHHPVIRQDRETTKVRLVYDASAKDSSGVSLNQCLYPGPCLLKTVSEVITRFRLNPIALTSDIEKAFLMISIDPSDRDVLRFLWVEDAQALEPKVITYRFGRVCFGITCSPFLLNATLKRHIEGFRKEYPDVCDKLMNSLYVDDVNSGGHSIEEVMQLYEKSKQLMAEGAFHLRKWHSNSEEVMSRIQQMEAVNIDSKEIEKPLSEEDQSFAKTTLQPGEKHHKSEENKVLGLSWDSDRDMIVFKFSELAQLASELSPTKRNVLKIVAKIFDPQGLITPVTAQLKVFLQKLFKENLAWDEPIPDKFREEWTGLVSKLNEVEEIAVPRYYFGSIDQKPAEVELFGFCDSSESAYAASVYAKITINGKSRVSLVTSKSRVTPLSKTTIPRLELLSCLILARLIDSVKETLSPLVNVKVVKCWTDSITALYWIRGEQKEWKLFVENRVQEIRKLVAPHIWSHCPGKENPADIPTRSYDPTKLVSNSVWWNGPTWLEEDSSNWPKDLAQEETPESCLDEMKLNCKRERTSTVLLNQTNKEISISRVINSESFSNYWKLLRVTAYVLRFINACRKKLAHPEIQLSAAEIDKSEKLWIHELQKPFDHQKLEELNKHLGLFRDENGIVRCKGRLSRSSLNAEAKYPVLIPRDHHVSTLIVRHCHNRVMHNGPKETLAELRSRFWIVKGRQLVRKIVHQCTTCKRIQGLSYRAPERSQLPEFRVHEEHPFASVGIDFAGPLYVKSKSRSSKKVYLALFTCGTTRAVHLELVPDLATETFLLCFKRFVSRRGVPGLVVTDNAKTFKAASKKLIALFKSAGIRNYLNERKIMWKYNLAKAPWWGGFYERLIRVAKLCLKKCVGTANLSYDELHTVITEIESVMNSRPLTYLYPEEIEESLTPSHLLCGRRLTSLPEFQLEKKEDRNFDEKEDVYRKREQYLTRVLRHYWNRWKSEYLIDLREYHAERKRRIGVPVISEGDVVTIEDENRKNRTSWRLGRIESIKKGQDNVARGAVVVLANGNRIERPIQKLYPLEVSQEELKDKPEITEVIKEPEVTRPKRQAAVIAKERINIIDQLENEH